MPKFSYRCKSRGHGGSPPPASVAFMAPPRKVSFEDGFTSLSEPASPVLSPVPTALTEGPKPLTRSTLARPKFSRSLVELANSVESNNDDVHNDVSAPVSPILPQKSGQVDLSSSPQMPSSPWGQFVDMVIPEDGATRGPAAAHQYHGLVCSCCTSCRRRRANPYGDYSTTNKNKQRRPLSFLQNTSTSHFNTTRTTNNFRLSPRKEPTDQLIGALGRLQVVDEPAPTLLFF